ncbi:hypothetical protein J7643_14400 [bacterium]|nr:hypothetical protein [bacterium]
MAQFPQNGSPRGSGQLQRARGTAPLDGYMASQPAATGTGPLDQVLRREDLMRELAQGEKLVSTLRPRVKALDRAIAVHVAPEDALDEVFIGVTESERNFTMRLSRVVAESPARLRQVQVLVTQFRLADQALAEAKIAAQQFEAANLTVGRVEGFSLTKFKGSLYPLYYFSTMFPGVAMLESLFPHMRQPAQTQPLSRTQPLPPLTVQPIAQPEPAPAEPMEKLGKLVGDLWRKSGFLKKT